MDIKMRDVILFFLVIAVIIGLLSYFGVINLSEIYDWLYNLFFNY